MKVAHEEAKVRNSPLLILTNIWKCFILLKKIRFTGTSAFNYCCCSAVWICAYSSCPYLSSNVPNPYTGFQLGTCTWN
jgi:hypothetical protein